MTVPVEACWTTNDPGEQTVVIDDGDGGEAYVRAADLPDLIARLTALAAEVPERVRQDKARRLLEARATVAELERDLADGGEGREGE